jgi:hypothetical protein
MDPLRGKFGEVAAAPPQSATDSATAAAEPAPRNTSTVRPATPDKIPQKIVAIEETLPDDAKLVYRPGLWGHVKLHFVEARGKLDVWQDCHLVKSWHVTSSSVPWEGSVRLLDSPHFAGQADARGQFEELPAELAQESSYKVYAKELGEYAYQTQALPCWRCGLLDEDSRPDETEEAFRIRLSKALGEKRDAAQEQVSAGYDKQIATISDKIAKAQSKFDQQRSQYWGGIFGTVMRGIETAWAYASGRATYRKTTSTVSAAKKAAAERSQSARADEQLQNMIAAKVDLETQRDVELAEVASRFDPTHLKFDKADIRPRKADIDVQQVALVWLPYRIDAQGQAVPAY